MRRFGGTGVLLANVLLGIAVFAGPAVGRAAEPARQWVVYLLPHSHVDIGYTALQPDVERKQMQNLRRGAGTVPQDGRLSARGPLQVEHRSLVGGG